MKDFIDISFQPINQGVGFSSEEPRVFSYYEKNDDNLLENSDQVFENLLDSPEFFDRLEERLENPILESLKGGLKKPESDKLVSKSFTKTSTPVKQEMLDPTEEIRESSPLNWFFLPPLAAMRVDFTFTLGLYLFGGILTAVVFELSKLPSLFWIFFSYGVFHQIYLVVCRSLIGSSLGEERCNISWNTRSSLDFILRGVLFTLTGFILIPLASILIRKDLSQSCTNQQLEYNV